MTLHEVLNSFFELNISEMKTKQNIHQHSVWYDAQPQPFLINFKETETYTIMRFHHFDGENNYRVSYDAGTDRLIYTVMGTISLTITIGNFSSYKSEDNFFQDSLINDYNDLSFEDIDKMMNMFYNVKNTSLSLFGEDDEI